MATPSKCRTQPIQLQAKCMYNEIPYDRSLSLHVLLTRYDEDETLLKQSIHNL